MKTHTSKKSLFRHLVPNNSQADQQLTGGKDLDDKAIEREKRRTLYDGTYRSHYYQTHKGHWKRSDEPDEAEQLRQSDRIQQILKRQNLQKASRERLKQKPGGVPVRSDGKKLFDEFMREAYSHQPRQGVKKNTKDLEFLRNLYNAASALEFEKWIEFILMETSNL